MTCATCMKLAQENDALRARVAELEARLVVPETVRLVRRVFLAAHERAIAECKA
jgi:BMFP domain-containing protein YqiC